MGWAVRTAAWWADMQAGIEAASFRGLVIFAGAPPHTHTSAVKAIEVLWLKLSK